MAAVERVQQVADRLALNAQQRLAQEIQEQRTLAETQVEQTNPKSGEVEPELKRKNPYVKRRRKQDKKADEPAETGGGPPPEIPPAEPHKLDVTI